MVISYLYIKQKLGLNLSLEEVVDIFNNLGYEVERSERFSEVEGVRFGLIEEVSPNPNSDHITICRVRHSEGSLTIQTAAKNVYKGAYVVLFPPGSRSGERVFEAKELRGVISEGMLASYPELGFRGELLPSELREGVLCLPPQDLTLSPVEVFGLDDYLITISVLANRPEANSLTLLLAEIAAYLNLTTHPLPNLGLRLGESEVVGVDPLTIKLDLSSFQPTTQELLLVVRHGLAATTKHELLTSLIQLNFGLWSLVLDAEKVAKVTLKEVEIEGGEVEALTAEGEVVAYSGLPAMETYLPSSDTTPILLVLPTLNPQRVRGDLRLLGREHEVNQQALRQRYLPLLGELIGFLEERLGLDRTKLKIGEERGVSLAISEDLISSFTGIKDPLSSREGEAVLRRMSQVGYHFTANLVAVPSYRSDILNQQDLIGDYMRYLGYDRLNPLPPKLVPLLVVPPKSLRERAAALGYQEVITFSLTSRAANYFNPLGLPAKGLLKSVVSSERELLRYSVFNTLNEVITHNLKRKISPVNLFDIGMVSSGERAILLASDRLTTRRLKDDIVRLSPGRELTFKRVEEGNPYLAPKQSLYILEGGVKVGWIGRIHPSIVAEDIYAAELFLPSGEGDELREVHTFKPYPKEILKRRSLTLLRERGVDVSELAAQLEAEPGVYSIELSDTYLSEEGLKLTFTILIEEGYVKDFEARYY